MNKTPNALAILVLSCDKYADIWQAFYYFFQQYWPDCSFPVYHCSDARPYTGATGAFPHEKVTNLLPGKPTEWSARLLYALENIPEPYVLLLLEDYIPIKPVQNAELSACLEFMQAVDAACFRLLPCPPPTHPLVHTNPFSYQVGLVAKDSPYRASTQAALWEKAALKAIINPKENVWDFEEFASQRTTQIEKPFICLYPTPNATRMEEGEYPYTYLCTAVVHAKWTQEAFALCAQHGIRLDTDYRPVETQMDIFRRTKYARLPGYGKHIFDYIYKRVNV